MEEQQIGWIAAIIVGGIAGWLAEQFMKSEMGLVMNIVLGIIGAAVASWLMGFLGISLGGGWIAYLIAGFIGACILIAVARALTKAAACLPKREQCLQPCCCRNNQRGARLQKSSIARCAPLTALKVERAMHSNDPA